MTWPRPLPTWFWPWLKWYLGKGEYIGLARNMAYRPAGAPKKIPQWAWDRLKLHVANSAPPPPPPLPSTDDTLAFWRRMSFWVTRIDHFPPLYATEFAQGQYPIAIVPTLYGTDPDIFLEELIPYTKDLQNRGFKVCGSQWGKGGGEVEAAREAEAALDAISRYGFDGWVMNGEKSYEGGGQSAAYVRWFRSTRPHLPLGWSPEVRLALDHTVLQENRVCYMPQVYPLEIPVATMSYAAEWADNFGYERRNVVPLVQAYKSPEGIRHSAITYREQARFLGLPGVCLYTANQCVDAPEFWRALAY